MRVEILAPGGSVDGIYSCHGCMGQEHAIYAGTQRFSARAFADNPSVEQLCDILDFAHVRDKKIYLTVNTLLTDEELEAHLYDLLLPLYDNGLDAVIVQDIGVMQFIHEAFPGSGYPCEYPDDDCYGRRGEPVETVWSDPCRAGQRT